MLDNWDRQSGSIFSADGEPEISVPSDDNSQKKTVRRGEKKEKHSHSFQKEVTIRKAWLVQYLVLTSVLNGTSLRLNGSQFHSEATIDRGMSCSVMDLPSCQFQSNVIISSMLYLTGLILTCRSIHSINAKQLYRA